MTGLEAVLDDLLSLVREAQRSLDQIRKAFIESSPGGNGAGLDTAARLREDARRRGHEDVPT